ncbi:putative 2-oxo-4-hydroxy-4-carboxy-5-ureidoimidazoline decarboxylase [Notamacropus eugenii]|uniref:putative 2-oxo-4-hydroxy-4-carboxy-5-ureidoimidazoline decarboxylase n=1 Tax=Notamacropus eugenii TaxID=9315 RepID=UPI003B6763A9
MDFQKINSMGFGEFVDVFGNIIEKCPLIAAAIWSQRPFADLADLEKHVFDFIEALPQSGKEGILRCHPDLAGRELQLGTLTPESQREQRNAGLRDLDREERRQMDQLNCEYKKLFGFPFVIAARLSDKATMMRELARRLRNQPSQELCAALDEVRKICHLRLEDILRSPMDP